MLFEYSSEIDAALYYEEIDKNAQINSKLCRNLENLGGISLNKNL